MSGLDIEALGFTKEELQNRIVDRYIEGLNFTTGTDEDGSAVDYHSSFHKATQAAIQKAIDTEIARIGEVFVLPKVTDILESHVIQKTDKWGHPIEPPVTLTEYMTKRASEYITEQVDYSGKSKAEDSSSYGWKGTQTRVSHLIEKHLHHHISDAVKSALADLNSAVAKGISDTVKLKIEETLKKLKIETKVG